MEQTVYLDYNATTPLDERVLQTMMPYLTGQFGNASSRQHAFGWVADEAVNIARKKVARLIGAGAEEIYFSSGATESVNLAIKGVYEAYQSAGSHMVCLATEHKAVLDTYEYLHRRGAEITVLPVGQDGIADLELFAQSLRKDTLLASVMLANNETGVLQPIEAIAEICAAKNVLLFCDATQAAGKIQVNVRSMNIPLLALSAHKMYGPKGTGALYISRKNPRVSIVAQLHGGGHEGGKRSGTLNVPGIAGMGKAAELGLLEMDAAGTRLGLLRDEFENRLAAAIPGLKINGNLQHRLPHVSNLAFPGVSAAEMMSRMPGLAIAAGSACSAADLEPSHVLRAMGLSRPELNSSLRFSLGRMTTATEMDYAANLVAGTWKKLSLVSI